MTVKTRVEVKQLLQDHKSELLSRYHVGKIDIFDSYVRNEPTEQSDLDVIVEFTKPMGFFEFMDLDEYIEKIYLVSAKGLKPHIRKSILNEVMYV